MYSCVTSLPMVTWVLGQGPCTRSATAKLGDRARSHLRCLGSLLVGMMRSPKLFIRIILTDPEVLVTNQLNMLNFVTCFVQPTVQTQETTPGEMSCFYKAAAEMQKPQREEPPQRSGTMRRLLPPSGKNRSGLAIHGHPSSIPTGFTSRDGCPSRTC